MSVLRKMSLRSWLQFLTCSLGAFAIFYVLFCRASFYDAFITAMGVTNTQFGTCYAVYGWIAVVGYLIGGFVADRVAPRWLMFISFFVTGVCNFILGLWPNYTVTLILYAIMGVSTTITFWDAMLKCVRIFGRSIGEENRAFTWYQVCRGFGEMFISTAIVLVFTKFVDMIAGLRFVLWFYAGLLILFSIISLLVFDSGKDELDEKRAKEDRIMTDDSVVKQTIRLLKNPELWFVIAIAFGGYNIGSCIGSYLGDIAGSFGAATATVALLGTLNAWLKPIGAAAANFITKKKGPTWILQACTYVYMVILVAFLLIPRKPENLIYYVALLCVEIIMTGAFRSQKFAQCREAGVMLSDTGNAYGIVSTIIFSTDAFMPVYIGIWLDTYDEVTAYNKLFYWLLASGALTLVAAFIFRRRNKEKIAELIAHDAKASASETA
jgi:predicted MFS family arabinose efflux permease